MTTRQFAAVLLALAIGPAWGQVHPARVLRLVVPFTPAGATDSGARLPGEELARRLGQPVVIENRPGAGGNIGAQIAVRAAPDGITLLMAPTSIYCIAMTPYGEPGLDLVSDLAPVSTMANIPHVLIAQPALPARDLTALLALARAQPGKLTIAE